MQESNLHRITDWCVSDPAQQGALVGRRVVGISDDNVADLDAGLLCWTIGEDPGDD
jgi:hypothetical protein